MSNNVISAFLQQKQQKKKGRDSSENLKRSLPLFNFKMKESLDSSPNSTIVSRTHQDNNNTDITQNGGDNMV